jgi:acetylornithine deacetylase/succinyl-diaminopimelate desuccinylase-like protein
MHVEAAAALASDPAPVNREVIVCAVADEEAGGEEGAGWVTREHAEELGFGTGRPPPEVLGEGSYGLSGVLDRPIMPIVLGEKTAVWVRLQAEGDPGHGSLPPANQAPANLVATLKAVTGYRSARVHPVMREQFGILAENTNGARRAAFRALGSGAGTPAAKALARKLRSAGPIGALLSDTATLTMLNCGYKRNVVPGEASAELDCRLLPDTDPDDFVRSMRKVAARRDVFVDVEASHGGPVSDKGTLFDALAGVSRRHLPDAIVVPSLTSGFTDVRHFRALGATGYGWAPVVLTPELLSTIHGHDERIPVDGFERAVRAMTELVETACS